MCMCVWSPMHVSVLGQVCAHECRCLWSPAEGARSPGARVIGGCKPPTLGTGNCKNNACAKALRHLSSPSPCFLRQALSLGTRVHCLGHSGHPGSPGAPSGSSFPKLGL